MQNLVFVIFLLITHLNDMQMKLYSPLNKNRGINGLKLNKRLIFVCVSGIDFASFYDFLIGFRILELF